MLNIKGIYIKKGYIENLVREKKITVKQAFVKYKRYLKEYDLFWGKDITCYLYNLTFVRARKRAVLLFKECLWINTMDCSNMYE